MHQTIKFFGGPSESMAATSMRSIHAIAAAGAVGAAYAFSLALRRRASPRLIDLVKNGRKAICVGKNYTDHILERALLSRTLS